MNAQVFRALTALLLARTSTVREHLRAKPAQRAKGSLWVGLDQLVYWGDGERFGATRAGC
jgi:hypothetical protein